MEQLQTKNNIKYAGFGMRMLASTIDTGLSAIILVPFFTLFNKIYGNGEIQAMLTTGALKPEDMSHQQIIEYISRIAVSFISQNIILAIAVILFWIYCSATPGKMLLRMKIIDKETGGKPTRKQLIIRYLGYIISTLPIGLGFIWIYYDKKHQGWHDKLAGTVVIYNQ